MFVHRSLTESGLDVLQFDRDTGKLPGYREGGKAFVRILAYLVNDPAVEPVRVAQA